jgi:succinyl-CoA synthetase alpha subunit
VLLLKNAAGPPEESAAAALEEVTAADEPVCSCMSGAMKKTAVNVAGATVELTALEPILRFVGGLPDLSPEQRRDELLRQVKLYNGAVSEVCEGDLAAALYELLIAGKGA